MVRKSFVRYFTIGTFLVFFSVASIFSQSKHQRLGVEKEGKHILTPELSVTYNYSDLNGYDVYGFQLNLGVQYLYMNKFSISSSIPLYMQTFKQDYSNYLVSLTNGDASLTLGYLTKITDYKLHFHIKYTYPLGIWNHYETQEKMIKGGSGYHTVNIFAGIAKITDPVVLNATVSYSIDFPRKERFGWSMNPGRFIVSTNYTEILNDEIGIRIGMDNYISLPFIVSGKLENTGIQYQLAFNFSLLFNKQETNLQFGLSKIATDTTNHPSININANHEFYF